LNNEELSAALVRVPWRTAKSSPHQYFLRYQDPVLHDVLVERIASRGRLGSWGSFRQRYFVFAGNRYWRMGAQTPEAIRAAVRCSDAILNRAVHREGDIVWLDDNGK
jgi:hypothetical protein